MTTRTKAKHVTDGAIEDEKEMKYLIIGEVFIL